MLPFFILFAYMRFVLTRLHFVVKKKKKINKKNKKIKNKKKMKELKIVLMASSTLLLLECYLVENAKIKYG